MIGTLTVAWQRYWFSPAGPTDLAIARALFYTGLLLGYSADRPAAWGAVDAAFWMPISAFTWLHLEPASVPVLAVLHRIWQLSLCFSAVGLFGRPSMAVAAILGFYLLGLPHNFGHTFHFDAALVLTMIVLACSRATDAWSLDRLRHGSRQAPPVPSGEYTWPIRLVWILVASVFVAAGLSKLRHGGIEWVLSANLSLILTKAMYHVSDADPLTTAGVWIAGHEWLSRVLAGFALLTELGFAVVPFSRRARLVLVPAAVALLLGIRTLMGPTFGGFLVVHVFWIPWRVVVDRLAARFSHRRRVLALRPVPAATAYMDGARTAEERLL